MPFAHLRPDGEERLLPAQVEAELRVAVDDGDGQVVALERVALVDSVPHFDSLSLGWEYD